MSDPTAEEKKIIEKYVEEKPVSKYAPPPRKIIVSEENAREQVTAMLDKKGIDFDVLKTKEEVDAIDDAIDIIKRAVMYGDFEIIDDDGETLVKQNIKHRSKGSTVDSITFGELRGKAHRNAKPGKNETDRKLSIMAGCARMANDTANKIIDDMRESDLNKLEDRKSVV